MIKAVPNILSATRLLLSFSLYFLGPLSAAYLLVYAVCAVTDPLDGFIARRYVPARGTAICWTVSATYRLQRPCW